MFSYILIGKEIDTLREFFVSYINNLRVQSSLVMPDPGSESGAGLIRHPGIGIF